MALGDNTGGAIYLSIKQGRLVYKDKKTGEKKDVGFVSGFITGVRFDEKEWEGQKWEECALSMVDGDDKYVVQMKTDSGYFRAFCNALKSGDPTKKVKLSPTFSEEGSKKSSGMFVNQGSDKALPWYSTKNDPKDVPALKAVTFKGKTVYDGSEQIEYWKKWLNSISWTNEFEASSLSQPTFTNTPAQTNTVTAKPASNKINEDDDFIKSLDLDEDPF